MNADLYIEIYRYELGGRVEWIDWAHAPSLFDYLTLVGLATSSWAAFAARNKAKAVERSIATTRSQIATSQLRQALDDLKNLAEMLDRAIKDEDGPGARYILVWIARESTRSSTLMQELKLADSSKSDAHPTVTGLLDKLSRAASEAKKKIVRTPEKIVLQTKPVVGLLTDIEQDLVDITTRIGYGMEKKDVL